MKVLVTGGRGFIGTVTCQRLEADGHEVYHLDLVDGADVRSSADVYAAIAKVRPDRVLHLAGVLGTHELFDTPHLALETNVGGAINVIEACKAYDVGYTCVTLPYAFDSLYRWSKECADTYALIQHRQFGLPVSIVTAFNVFGPGQKYGEGHPQKFLPTWATLAWRNEPLPIWGDGDNRLDMVSTADLAHMFSDALLHDDGCYFDAGVGRTWTVLEVAQMVLDYTGSTAGVEHLPMRRGETPTMAAAEGRGWDRLDWRPEFRLDEFHAAIDTYKPVEVA